MSTVYALSRVGGGERSGHPLSRPAVYPLRPQHLSRCTRSTGPDGLWVCFHGPNLGQKLVRASQDLPCRNIFLEELLGGFLAAAPPRQTADRASQGWEFPAPVEETCQHLWRWDRRTCPRASEITWTQDRGHRWPSALLPPTQAARTGALGHPKPRLSLSPSMIPGLWSDPK